MSLEFCCPSVPAPARRPQHIASPPRRCGGVATPSGPQSTTTAQMAEVVRRVPSASKPCCVFLGEDALPRVKNRHAAATPQHSNHKPPRTTTNHHEPPRTTMNHHEPPRITTNHQEPPRTTTNYHESPRTTRDHHEPPQTTTNHHKLPRTTTNQHEPPETTTNHHEPPRTTTKHQDIPCTLRERPLSGRLNNCVNFT